MEDYLKQLKPNIDGTYILPAGNFTRLKSRYSEMKKEINECVEIKRECEILKQNEKHVQNQYFEIQQIKFDLDRVRQENNELKIQFRKALDLATKASKELQSIREQRDKSK
jgi:hypothetical protein